jgi:hypothetical protein
LGIENPGKVIGNGSKKSENYKGQVDTMRELGIISIVTCVSDSSLEYTEKEWIDFIKNVGGDINLVFPMTRVPGSRAVPATLIDAIEPLKSYDQMTSEKDMKFAYSIGKSVTLLPIKTLVNQLIHKSPRRAAILATLYAGCITAQRSYEEGLNQMFRDVR